MRIDWNAERELFVSSLNGGRGQVAARLCPLDCGKALWSRLPAGASIGEHRHETSTDINFVIAGRGRAVTDGVPEELAPGVCHVCPKGSTHAIENTGEEDLVLLTVVCEHEKED